MANIDQRIGIDELTILPTPVAIEIRNRQKFCGIGPLVGVDADWDLGCDFSIYGNAAVSWLYGRHKVRLEETSVSATAVDFFDVSSHIDATVAVFDAGLGVRWHTCLCGNTQLVLQLGLEHHRYYDYNRIGGYGDLSFDGLTFGAGIQF